MTDGVVPGPDAAPTPAHKPSARLVVSPGWKTRERHTTERCAAAVTGQQSTS